MKRAQLGDVFAFRTDRGYRIIHWVYHIERQGKFVKVFPGFYQEKPENLEAIIDGDCSYMINFDARKLYNKGVFELWGSYPNRDLIPFPTHDIEFRRYGRAILFRISQFTCHQNDEQFIGDSTGKGIPEKYNHLRLLNLLPHPLSFLHMLSSGFDLHHFDLYWPKDGELEVIDQKYGNMIFGKEKK